MAVSIVITSYNRKAIIRKAIDSCIAAFHHAHDLDSEIVIIDDASTDSTATYLKGIYKSDIDDGRLRIIAMTTNQGVTGAKNAGYLAAKKDWVLLLDSDDTLIPTHWAKAMEAFNRYAACPILFFRCINQNGQYVGRYFNQDYSLDFKTYVNQGSYGEVLTAINKKIVTTTVPYNAELRGYEGIGCAKIIQKYGPAMLSKLVLRIYNQTGDDRLSSTKIFISRMPLLSKGHLIFFGEFRSALTLKNKLAYLIKVPFYLFVGSLYNWLKRFT